MKGPRFFRALQLCCSCSQVALKSDESSAEADSWQSFNVISFSPSIWNIRRPFRKKKKVSVIMVFSEHKHLLKADEHGLAIIFRNDRSWGPCGAARLGAALRSLISAWRRHPGRAGSWEFQAVECSRRVWHSLCASISPRTPDADQGAARNRGWVSEPTGDFGSKNGACQMFLRRLKM